MLCNARFMTLGVLAQEAARHAVHSHCNTTVQRSSDAHGRAWRDAPARAPLATPEPQARRARLISFPTSAALAAHGREIVRTLLMTFTFIQFHHYLHRAWTTPAPSPIPLTGTTPHP